MEYKIFWLVVVCVVNVVYGAVEGDVRLIDGISNSNQGRVEVYHGSAWGTVCGKGWSVQEAVVICRQLNLGDVLLWKAFFGNGSGAILVGAHCHDHDFHINECEGSWEEDPTTCTHEEDVAVICYPDNHEEASSGLTIWLQLIIAMAFGIALHLFLKVVKFIETSKIEVDDDEIALQEIHTKDHPLAASQQVSISDERSITRSENDAGTSTRKNDVTPKKDDVILRKDDVTESKSDSDAIGSKSFVASNITDGDHSTSGKYIIGTAAGKCDVENAVDVRMEDDDARRHHATAIKSDVTGNESEGDIAGREIHGGVTSSKNHIAVDESDVIGNKSDATASKSADDTKESTHAAGATSRKNYVTKNRNDVTSGEHSTMVNGSDNEGRDMRQIPVDKANVIQNVEMSVQTEDSP